MSTLINESEILDNQVDFEYRVSSKRKKQPANWNRPNCLCVEVCKFHVFRSCVAAPEGDEILHCFPEEQVQVGAGNFLIDISYLLSDELAKQKIPYYLSVLKVPVANHAQIIQTLCSVARRSSIDSSIVLAMAFVKVKIFEYNEYLAISRAAEIQAMESHEPKPIPATKASIDALEKVLFDDAEREGLQQCMICMEEFETGTEVTSMPCSHIYHGHCIVKWLETSHFCPLCRFPMPHHTSGPN